MLQPKYILLFCVLFIPVVSAQDEPVTIEEWTQWFDSDDPDGLGDSELLDDLRSLFPFLICSFPFGIECQTTSFQPYTATGQTVTCNPAMGLQCLNADNQPENCLDYRVRFRCGEPIDECASSPCLNGGTCNDLQNAFECVCVNGYEGARCEIETNECASNPCQNGGQCLDLIGLYFCNCPLGYLGVNCETDNNECSSNPCVNGNCQDNVNAFLCICFAGYRGTTCQIDINECASSPCQNGGTCIDQVNGYQCQCPFGYIGQFCQTGIIFNTDFDLILQTSTIAYLILVLMAHV
ncbi:fibropellin-3-like [Anneissia japonica]|uniref:fibropellin-3-like n=1 Tax=Anneissia japonica TaxID=1529436 RepID=UPI0014257B33|nr:fibropellin-3-like [Anneissia japonica]